MKAKNKSVASSGGVDDWEMVSESEAILEYMEDPFKDKWCNLQHQCYEQSNLKQYKSYKLQPMIVKANDDLRQEVLAI